MTRNQSLAFRAILFALGAGVVVLAFFLVTDGRAPTQADGFMWVSVALAYLVCSLPFFFSAFRTDRFSDKIPSLALVWLGVFIYVPLSIGIIVLLKTALFSFNAAVIAQAIFVFAFAVNVYFGYFANSHVRSVASEEAGLREQLSEIKQKAALLSLAVDQGGFEKAQVSLRQALDDIKYLSPVRGDAAKKSEAAIIMALDSVKQLCDAIAEGAHPSNFERDAERLLTLVRVRKLLRN
ncbi:MAG: hypothetical protein LBG27_13600 [Spirochaetaceae bacterium]|jgi:hypothetical protein|nr:hypothetical protein [Spirochaetaceae bacterium]